MTIKATVAKLKELAGKATAGPWILEGEYVNIPNLEICNVSMVDPGGRRGETDWHFGPQSKANAEYIAAANPQAISALIAHTESQDARIEALEAECERVKGLVPADRQKLIADLQEASRLFATSTMPAAAKLFEQAIAALATPATAPLMGEGVEIKQVLVGTIGHVDHGKHALASTLSRFMQKQISQEMLDAEDAAYCPHGFLAGCPTCTQGAPQ